MEQHKILDNLSGQEIKEMIKREEISIEQLDKRALDVLFEYESEIAFVGEGDDELLRRCADLLDPVEQTEDVEQKYRDLIRNALKPKTVSDTPARKKRIRLRKVLIIAATFLVLVIGISAIAEAMGFGVFEYISEILGLSQGTHVDKGVVTLIHPNGSKEYASVEELLLAEDLNILYPSIMPEGVSIERIDIYDTETGGKTIRFVTGSMNTSVLVDTCVGSPPEDYIASEKYRVEDREYYLFEESLFYAISYNNNNRYTICSTNRENVILIIENMKELG